jgi:hypothetical protein
MANLYSAIGQNTRKVLTRSDNTGPETTWLIAYDSNGDEQWEGGESWSPTPELTPGNDQNYQAIVECIQTYCEVYEVVRPSTNALAIKVRANSVPYTGSEAALDGNANTVLTALVQAHPGLGATFSVWNGRFQGNSISYD